MSAVNFDIYLRNPTLSDFTSQTLFIFYVAISVILLCFFLSAPSSVNGAWSQVNNHARTDRQKHTQNAPIIMHAERVLFQISSRLLKYLFKYTNVQWNRNTMLLSRQIIFNFENIWNVWFFQKIFLNTIKEINTMFPNLKVLC